MRVNLCSKIDVLDGKNDGSVNGHSYFTCEAKHGVFVRATQVKILEVPLCHLTDSYVVADCLLLLG